MIWTKKTNIYASSLSSINYRIFICCYVDRSNNTMCSTINNANNQTHVQPNACANLQRTTKPEDTNKPYTITISTSWSISECQNKMWTHHCRTNLFLPTKGFINAVEQLVALPTNYFNARLGRPIYRCISYIIMTFNEFSRIYENILIPFLIWQVPKE